jgi:DNA polymerase-2
MAVRQITLWLSTPEGPVQLKVNGERPLCFIKQRDCLRVEEALIGFDTAYEMRPLELKSFQQQKMAALYLPTLRSFRRAVERLHLYQIDMLENDLRLHDRYLMERWIGGSVVFQGRHKSQRVLFR